MTRARQPRPYEVETAARDPRFLSARSGSLEESWRTKGRCQTVDPETFFPLPTEPADMALALCRSCPVSAACLRAALEAGDCEGVWGATTPRERRAMLVAWRNEMDSPQTTISPQPTILPQPTMPTEQPMLNPVGTMGGLRGSGHGSTRSLTHARREVPVRSAYDEQYLTV